MAGETNTDRIARLEQAVAKLDERIDNLRRDTNRFDVGSSEVTRTLQDVDKRLAVMEGHVQRLEKRLDDLLTHRLELSRLALAAFLGATLAIVGGLVTRSIERWVWPETTQAAPVSARPNTNP